MQIHMKSIILDNGDIIMQYKQGVVDGSVSKPALLQNTGYMVEKTYHIAPYLGAFGPF